MPRVLLITDSLDESGSALTTVHLAGYSATVCLGIGEIGQHLRARHFDAIVLRAGPHMRGKALSGTPHLPPIFWIFPEAFDRRVLAELVAGSCGHVSEPHSREELLEGIRLAVLIGQISSENQRLRHKLGQNEFFSQSESMGRIIKQVSWLGSNSSHVLIRGERGTGKRALARLVHEAGPRRVGPFITVSCSDRNPLRLEHEIFGAPEDVGDGPWKPGVFETAYGGTLFLREVSELPRELQTKLISKLASGARTDTEGIGTDVRVIGGTTGNPETLVEAGQLDPELLHHLSGYIIHLPALKERPEDIPLLADYFLRLAARANEVRSKSLHQDAYVELRRHSWPGSVKELKLIMEKLLLFSGPEITGADVRAALGIGVSLHGLSGMSETLAGRVESFERMLVLAELRRFRYQMTAAAKSLGLERSHLYKKCQQLSIDLRSVRTEK